MSQLSRILLGLSVMVLLVPLVSYAVTGEFAWFGDPAQEPITSASLALAEAYRIEAADSGGTSSTGADEFSIPAEEQAASADPEPTTTAADSSTTSGDQEADSSAAAKPASTRDDEQNESSHDDSHPPSAAAGATISGDACPCNVTGTSELKGTVNLKGDLMVDGGLLVARSGVTVNGNGFQIMFMNGGRADFQGSKTSTWSGNGSSANLTRDITFKDMRRIMFHQGAGKSTLRYFTIADSGNAGVLGDYPLHFHLNGNTVRGTLVEGVVVVNGRNHAFVPHGSHGITFRDTIAKTTTGEAYWWDPPGTNNCSARWEFQCSADNSNDIFYDHVLADGVKPTSSASQMHRNSAFFLSAGSGNVIRNSVARNVQGGDDCAGFHWPEEAAGNVGGSVWRFVNNTSVGSTCHGIFVWQNDEQTHLVENFTGNGVEHGAYRNAYEYRNLNVPYFEIHALGLRQVTGGSVGKVVIRSHNVEGGPVTFSNVSVSSVSVADNGDHPGIFHFNGTGISCSNVSFNNPHPNTKVMVDGTEC